MSSKVQEVPRRFAVASNPTLAEELIGKLVALRPLRVETVDTKLGPSPATYTRVVELDETGKLVADHGEAPIFWTVVRRQLAHTSSELPWIVGRLVLSGQAYRLDEADDLDPDEVEIALDLIDSQPA